MKTSLASLDSDYAQKMAWLYLNKHYHDFDEIVSKMDRPSLQQLGRLFEALQGSGFLDRYQYACLLRRVGMNRDFRSLFEDLPYYWAQATFYLNRADLLETRISIGFCEHPQLKDLEVDYTLAVYHADGKLLCTEDHRICPRQTHTYFLREVLARHQKNSQAGTIYIRTAYQHIASLRFYACWYNASAVASTHEKGALINAHSPVTFPVILADKRHETYVVLANVTDTKLSYALHVFNQQRQECSPSLMVSAEARQLLVLPLGSLFPGLLAHLGGRAGYLYLEPDSAGRTAYYYLIHNQETGACQIQHV